MKTFLKHYAFELLILLSVAVLAIFNYSQGTYLSGWDNLQTELNPWLGVKRALFSAWQEYQSFGLVAGNAHAADLLRAIFVWLISFILPQSFVRYFFHILMVLIGGLGALKLLEFLGFNKEKNPIAFLGALFYIFNLGTVQIFFLPFESFSTFFAALPWEIWIFIKVFNILRTTKGFRLPKKELLIFLIINILATPQNFIQTIFVVYMILLGVLILYSAIEDRSFSTFIKGSVLCILIIFVNTFWILPQIYFLKTSVSVVRESKTNILATEDTVFQNKEKGTLPDFFKMEGLYYDLKDAHQQPIFGRWQAHFNNPLMAPLPYLFAAVILIGLISKRKMHGVFIIWYLLAAVALLSATFPFSFINDLFRQNFFINQIFRSPFTKFIIPYALVASYLFASGLYILFKLLQSRIQLNTLNIKKLYIGVSLLIFMYAFPVFQGYFFSPEMKVKIPADYMHVMEYFKHQDPNKRIALLPEYTIWGWFINSWGYNGSGFLWYGVEQPIISRTFDVWSNKSESYFWEMKAAVEAEDVQQIESIAQKYDVSYFVLDNTSLPVSSSWKALQLNKYEEMFAKSSNVHLVHKWGQLLVYEVANNKQKQNFVSVAQHLPNIGPIVQLTNSDTAFKDHGPYISDTKRPYQIYYPFLDLISQTRLDNKKWGIHETENTFVLQTTLQNGLENYSLPESLPIHNAVITTDEGLKTYPSGISISRDGTDLKVIIEKELLRKFNVNKTSVLDCDTQKPSTGAKSTSLGLEVLSKNGASRCFGYRDKSLEQREGYMVRVNNKNTQGRKLFFYILDLTKQQSYLEDRLVNSTEYYIIPPRYDYGIGYAFNFQNTSYKNQDADNVLNDLSIYYVPYNAIKQISLTQENANISKATFTSNFTAKKINYYTYAVQPNALPNQDTTLVLTQSFHAGWKAYSVDKIGTFQSIVPFLYGSSLPNHITVNNWANGWRIDSGTKQVIMIFWPQYLEYLGIIMGVAVLFITLVWSFVDYKRLRRKLA